MAAATSSTVKVGARGTIGSLISLEIEYCKTLEVDHEDVHRKHNKLVTDAESSSRSYRKKSASGNDVPKKKKAAGSNGGFLPSMCSVVDISEAGQVRRITGANNKNLRTVVRNLPDTRWEIQKAWRSPTFSADCS